MFNKQLKILLAVFILAAAITTTSKAGDDFGSPQEKASEWADWLSGKVGLSKNQYNQVYEIYLKYAEQYKADKEKNAGKVKGGYKPYRKKANEEIKPLLSDEQLKRWNGK